MKYLMINILIKYLFEVDLLEGEEEDKNKMGPKLKQLDSVR